MFWTWSEKMVVLVWWWMLENLPRIAPGEHFKPMKPTFDQYSEKVQLHHFTLSIDNFPLRCCRSTISPRDVVDWQFPPEILSIDCWVYGCTAGSSVLNLWLYGCRESEREREKWEREREKKRERERERSSKRTNWVYMVCKWDITFENLRTWVFGLILDISGRPHLEFILSERNVVLPKTNSGDSRSKNRNSPLQRSLWRNR